MEQRKPSLLHVLFTAGGAHQVTLRQAVDTFIRLELAAKSPATRSWYNDLLTQLSTTIGDDRPIGSIMEPDLLEWYSSLTDRNTRYGAGSSHPAERGPLSVFTLHGYVRAAHRFFRWLAKKGILEADISACLDLPRLPAAARKGIPDDARSIILDAAASLSARDFALLMFVDSTGCRRGGVAGLLLSDLNLDHQDDRVKRRAIIREKGEKERSVIMSPAALAALHAWLEERPALPGEDHVFLGKSPGHPWQPLKPSAISSIIRRYKTRLQLSGKVSPHQWRHAFSRRRLLKGQNLSSVSQLLGHTDIAITARYYGAFAIDQLQEVYDRYSDTTT